MRDNEGRFTHQKKRTVYAKTCSKCGELRVIEMFYSDPRAVDGHRSECKECTKKPIKAAYRKRCGLEHWRIAA